ncbi:MAG: VWA domain-containing protein [Thiohalocapsa sp.]
MLRFRLSRRIVSTALAVFTFITIGAPGNADDNSSDNGQTVTEALQQVFSTHEGPEAAAAGIGIIGDFFDQALSTPAGLPAQPPSTPSPGADRPATQEAGIPQPDTAKVPQTTTAGQDETRRQALQSEARMPADHTGSRPTASQTGVWNQLDSKPSAAATLKAIMASRSKPDGIAQPAADFATRLNAEFAAPPEPGKATALTRTTAPLGSGTLELIRARELDEFKAPIHVPETFSTADQAIYLALRATGADIPDLVRVSWLVADVEGLEAAKKLAETRTVLRAGAWRSAVLFAPEGGFWPGRYQVRVTLDEREPTEPIASLEFAIDSPTETAALMDEFASPPSGINIAQAALGGRLISSSSQAGNSSWLNDGLIDGFGYGGEDCKPSCGWASADRRLPQELIFGFRDQRVARLQAVVLDTQSCAGDEACLKSLPREVEIWVSTDTPNAGFEQVGRRRLRPVTGRHVIPLPDVKAGFVKLVIASNYGSSRRTQLAEVQILESAGPDSIVAALPIDLAQPALGGSLVLFTSEHYRGKAARVLGTEPGETGWRSADATLPQELTLGMRGDGAALIDRIELDLNSGFDAASRPREIAVELSSAMPLQGFDEVARIELPPGEDHLSIPIKRKARYVKLRLLANQGGSYSSLGKVALIEGKAPGYQSLLARAQGESATTPTPSSADPALRFADHPETAALEVFPGYAPEDAIDLELDQPIQAGFSAEQKRHYFKLRLPGQQPGMLNLDLAGLPFLRTRLRLLNAMGEEVARFQPTQDSGSQQHISWQLEPGAYVLEAGIIPADIVLAWDISRSLAGNMDLLHQAVTGFIQHVGTDDALALIAFNNELHVLMETFNSDRQQLLAAIGEQFQADMATRLYDAIALAIKLLSSSDRAPVVVVMTDGVDMGSSLTTPQFWDLLASTPVRIFTLGLGGELQVFDPDTGTSGGHLLRHIAVASGGRFIPIPTVNDLVPVYQQIATELMSGSRYLLHPGWTRAAGTLLVEAPADGAEAAELVTPAQIELVLDASGSMKNRVSGETRMSVAKRVLADLIADLPANTEVALRVYGHRIREGRPGDCQDTELLYPFDTMDKESLIERIGEIQALGTTPIAYSLAQTYEDFGEAAGEKTLVLVTDGEEECGGDLVRTVEGLKGKGLDVRLHIVGFALDDPTVVGQMQVAAQAGRGRYLSAADGGELKQAIAETLSAPYRVMDAAGRAVAEGMLGQPLSLPAGSYRIVLNASGGERVAGQVIVEEGELTRFAIGADGGQPMRDAATAPAPVD